MLSRFKQISHVIGKMKDETRGVEMEGSIGLKPKTC